MQIAHHTQCRPWCEVFLRLAGIKNVGVLCVLAVTVTSGFARGQASASSTSRQLSTTSAKKKTSSHKGKKSRKTASSRRRGQQKIDGERAQQIQEALIREHYLIGKPTGIWDTNTQAAMQKFQEDNGWQSKTTPDARALIKLGLGPDHNHLLNPESAMTSGPATPNLTEPKPSSGGDPAPAANNRPQ